MLKEFKHLKSKNNGFCVRSDLSLVVRTAKPPLTVVSKVKERVGPLRDYPPICWKHFWIIFLVLNFGGSELMIRECSGASANDAPL